MIAGSMPAWFRVKEVLAAALEQPPDRRSALLDTACAGQPDLRAEVESLLRAESAAGAFIETPALPWLDAVEDEDPRVGRPLGPYSIERCIGRGGMGAVYLARRGDNEFVQRVAIKMIRRGMDSALVIRRFRHERQILASLDHPHIARLFDGGTTPDGVPYFVMEYVEGTPIDRYADEHRLSTPDRLKLCLGVFDAVQHAHDRHVVHRDLKPGNVLVTADGQPKLLDFGIAKILDPDAEGDSTLTSLARPMTPDYASPEQVRGQPVTAATDVYALGLLLYELLTAHRPYRLTTGTREETASAICEQDPERPSTAVTRVETTVRSDGTTTTATPLTVSETRDGSPEALRQRLSGALDAIVLKALRKEPSQRYSTVAALAGDVRRWLDERPVEAGRDALRYGAVRLIGRHRAALGVTALLLAAIGITAVAVSRWPRAAAPVSAIEPGGGGPARAETRPSLAVGGFTNVSGRPADQWLSTALAEMLTTELAGGGQLRVLPADLVTRAARDLGVDAASAPTGGAIERMRLALATDYLVIGTFVIGEGTASRPLRIDIRVLHASDDPIAVAGLGQEARLFSMMADAGRNLRARLGLRESTPDATNGARAAFPQSLEATRLYAEGLARLRLLDAVEAQAILARADTEEPGNPLIQTALASAWTALGYDGRARDAARKAFDASGALTREDRLNVEGRLYEAQQNWRKAIDVYRTLWGFFSDNVEYGLRLAAAQTSAGLSADALSTVADLRRAPALQNADPRIDLAESQAASALADFPRALAAIERALQRAEQIGARLLAARAHLLEGVNYYSQGQPVKAEQALEIARRMFLDAGDRAGAASTLNSLGTVLSDREDITRGQQMYEQSLATSEEIGDRRGMSAALNNLGILLKDQGKLTDARRAHERALALRREIGDRNWTAVSLSNIGVVLFEQDRLREATKYYAESLAISREIGDKRGQIRARHNLAVVQREVGNFAEARAGCEESLAMRAEIADRRGSVIGHVELGILLLQQGEIGEARKHEEEAVRLARETLLKPGEAHALFQLGEIAIAAGDLAGARRHHERALALRREMNETRTAFESQLALAALALEEGRPADAEHEAHRVAEALGQISAPLLAAADLLTARARLARQDAPGAAQALASAEQLSRQTERVSLRHALFMVQAAVDAAEGHLREARKRLSTLQPMLARSGMVLAELERRLLLLQIDHAGGRPRVQPDVSALEKDARVRGAGLIVRRVQSL
jgi:tetratricopeptide (TPR) repeat protein/tRNA A-37 threonylcarbamoyl transferase component Bud32/TolB-like protein